MEASWLNIPAGHGYSTQLCSPGLDVSEHFPYPVLKTCIFFPSKVMTLLFLHSVSNINQEFAVSTVTSV